MIFLESTIVALFNFYIEWNEKNQNRSMRQVLEVVSSLISGNPNQSVSIAVKEAVLTRTISIITRQSAQPLVKPAFKALEYLLSKKTLSTEDLIVAYQDTISRNTYDSPSIEVTVEESWDCLFSEVFDWMVLPDVSPAAGKFLVTVFRKLRYAFGLSHDAMNHDTASWQRWIRRGLSKGSEGLENVKNYLFPPLFKLDRPGSIAFLEDLNKQSFLWDSQSQEMDAHSLLYLAAMETGKKAGLVEDPGIYLPVGLVDLRRY